MAPEDRSSPASRGGASRGALDVPWRSDGAIETLHRLRDRGPLERDLAHAADAEAVAAAAVVVEEAAVRLDVAHPVAVQRDTEEHAREPVARHARVDGVASPVDAH